MARLTGFVFQDEYLAKLAKLSDQEVGRLVRALAVFHATGQEQELTGRESIAYDFIKEDILRIDKAYQTKCEKNRDNVNNRYQANTDVNENIQTDTNVNDRNQVIVIDKEKDIKEIPSKEGKKKSSRFSPPTLEEVKAYCIERNNGINAERWFDYYEANGWKVGKNPMKDWKASVRYWEKDTPVSSQPQKKVSAQNYTQRDYTEEELAGLTNNPINSILKQLYG